MGSATVAIPVWPRSTSARTLPADCLLRTGSQPRTWASERKHVAPVGSAHHQHQHRDELLPALDQPGRDDGSADRDGVDLSVTGGARRAMHGAGGWVAHHTGIWRATGRSTGRNGGCADGRRVADAAALGPLRITADRAYLSASTRRSKAAQFFLDTLVEEPAHHRPSPAVAVAREPAPVRHVDDGTGDGRTDPARAVRRRNQGRGRVRRDADLRQCGATRARLAPLQTAASWPAAGVVDDGTCRRPRSTTATCHLFGLFPVMTSTCAARPNWPRP